MGRHRVAQGVSPGHAMALFFAALIATLLANPPAGASEPSDFEVVPVIGHARQVERVDFSPDGRWMVSSSDSLEGTSRVWLDGRLRHVLPGGLATFSPDGATVVTAVEGTIRRSGAIRRFRVATGELLWETASEAISDLAITADGARVVAAGAGGGAWVLDLASGELERVIADRAAWLGHVALSADGALAASNRGKIVWLWEVATGAERCRLEGHSTMISDIEFAGDDAYLASSDHHGTVRVWDPKTCATRTVLQADVSRFDDLALSPDGNYLVAGGSDGAALWDVDSGQLRQSLRARAGDWISAVAADPGGEWFAVGHSRGAVSVLTPGAERPIRTLRGDFGLTSLTPSPDGHELAVGHFGIDLIPITLSNDKTVLPKYPWRVDGLALSHDASQLVTQTERGIRVWDLTTDRPPVELPGSLAVASADGAVVAVGSRQRGNGVKLWHSASRMIRAEARHDVTITAFALDRRGTTLATGAADGTVRLWHARTGEPRDRFAGPSSIVHHVALIENGRAVAASYPDGSLRVWDAGASTPRHVLYHPEREPTSNLRAVPSSSLVVAHVSNGGIYLWDLARGELKRPLLKKYQSLDAAAFPPGRVALALSAEPGPVMWSTETGRLLFTLTGHLDSVDAIAVLDREWLVTGARDGSLGWWNVEDGERRRILPLSRSGVTSLEVSGDLLVIGHRDGDVSIRRSGDDQEIVRLLSSFGGGWAVVTPDGRWDAPNQGRDPGLTVWSGERHGILAQHPDRHVTGLLARVMKPYVEAGRAAPSLPELPPAAARVAPPTATATLPVLQPPSLRDLEPSPRGILRPVVVDFAIRDRGAAMALDDHRLALRLPRCCGDEVSELHLADLTDPARPRRFEPLTIAGGGDIIDYEDGFVYLASTHELIVVDARHPEDAREVGRMGVQTLIALDAADGKLYAAHAFSGLGILDLERPERPSPVPRQPTDTFGSLSTIVARGSLLYAAGSESLLPAAGSFLQIIDVSDPARPTLLGRSIYSPGDRRTVRRMAVEGSHAYLAADDFGLLIFDVTQPAAPRLVTRLATPGLMDVAVSGDRAYLADLYLGLQILDVATPSEPRFLGGDARAPEAGRGPGRVAIVGEHLVVSRYRDGVKIVHVK